MAVLMSEFETVWFTDVKCFFVYVQFDYWLITDIFKNVSVLNIQYFIVHAYFLYFFSLASH